MVLGIGVAVDGGRTIGAGKESFTWVDVLPGASLTTVGISMHGAVCPESVGPPGFRNTKTKASPTMMIKARVDRHPTEVKILFIATLFSHLEAGDH
jgi:hypothetical protein